LKPHRPELIGAATVGSAVGELLQQTSHGLYCEAGGFYIDPNRAVDRAVITHAHSDHARRGSRAYLCAEPCEPLIRTRLGNVAVESVPYGRSFTINGVQISFHPAGHILGSAQVRVEAGGEVWVVTGDYKTDPDPSCEPFELVPCDVLVTECTFGLPIYRWPHPESIFDQINAWWRRNQSLGLASVLFSYSLGKAQRLLCGVDATIGPIYTADSVERMSAVYRRTGIALPVTTPLPADHSPADWQQALIVAPGASCVELQNIPAASTAFASGWMRTRKRRRQAGDHGFVLSDHVDWPQLLDVVEATGAERVITTHGFAATVARYLRSSGIDASELARTAGDDVDDEAGHDVSADAGVDVRVEAGEDVDMGFDVEVDVDAAAMPANGKSRVG